MAKPPRQKHSKPRTKPVTIDLAAEPEPSADRPAEPVAFGTTAKAPPPTREDPAAAGEPKSEPASASGPASPGPAPKPKETPRTSSASSSGSKSGSALTGGLVGGLLALLIAAGGQWLGIIPSPGGGEPTISQDDLAAVNARLDEMAAQRADNTLGDTVTQLGGDVGALQQRVTGLEAAVADATSQPATGETGNAALSALQQRLDDMEAAIAGLPASGTVSGDSTTPAAGDASALQARVATLGDELGSLSERLEQAAGTAELANEGVKDLNGQVAGLGSRIDALDDTVGKLSSRPDSALPIAAAALKSAIDRGGSFAQELETYAGITGDAETVEALRDFAGGGIPTTADLLKTFPAAANAMLDAVNTPDENAGLLDRLTSSARGLVRIRPVGEVEGEGPDAVIARIEARLQDGEPGAALAEYETLPDAAKQAGAVWADRLRSRITANKLVEDKLNAALSGVGN